MAARAVNGGFACDRARARAGARRSGARALARDVLASGRGFSAPRQRTCSTGGSNSGAEVARWVARSADTHEQALWRHAHPGRDEPAARARLRLPRSSRRSARSGFGACRARLGRGHLASRLALQVRRSLHATRALAGALPAGLAASGGLELGAALLPGALRHVPSACVPGARLAVRGAHPGRGRVHYQVAAGPRRALLLGRVRVPLLTGFECLGASCHGPAHSTDRVARARVRRCDWRLVRGALGFGACTPITSVALDGGLNESGVRNDQRFLVQCPYDG